MIDNLRTTSYFTIWGLIYGLGLGAFSGTAILPYLGTIYSAIWGTGIGFACGLLSGVIAAVVRSISFHRDTDLDQFRRRLSLGMGLLNAVAAPVVLFATTNGVLWGSGLYTDMKPWTAFSMFAASFWGSLSAGYIASHYTHFIARLTAHREFDEGVFELPQTGREVSTTLNHLTRTGTRWIYGLGALAGGVLYVVYTSNITWSMYRKYMTLIEVPLHFAVGMVLGVIATFFFGLYVASGNAAFLAFLKRLIFREYFSHLPPHWTRRILTLVSFIFTLGICYWTFFFAPLVAAITAFQVYRSVALPDETLDKAKRKEKNALALEENTEDDDLLHEMDLTQRREQTL